MHIVAVIIIALLVVLIIDSYRYGLELAEHCDRLEKIIDEHNKVGAGGSGYDRAISLQQGRAKFSIIQGETTNDRRKD